MNFELLDLFYPGLPFIVIGIFECIFLDEPAKLIWYDMLFAYISLLLLYIPIYLILGFLRITISQPIIIVIIFFIMLFIFEKLENVKIN
jgi:hypothetical protein